jgi:hypothetical protein
VSPIYIASASNAAKRALVSLCRAAQMTPVEDKNTAHWLVDGQHPPKERPPASAHVLRLGGGGEPSASGLILATPMRPEVLIEALQRFISPTIMTLAQGWHFDVSQRQLLHPTAAPIHLTEKEALLLSALLEAAPAPVSRETLLKKVWAYGEDVTSHTVETHIYRLRHKCEAAAPPPCAIVTEAEGYRLVCKASGS